MFSSPWLLPWQAYRQTSARRRLGIPPGHICGRAVSLPKKNPLKNLVSGSSHVLPRGCAKSAVESGVNLGNRGLMRYLPEALDPEPPSLARSRTCDISTAYPPGRQEKSNNLG
jgi:hypothetical protein